MTTIAAYQRTLEKLRTIHDEGEARSLTRILFEDYFEITNPSNNKTLTSSEQEALMALTNRVLEGEPVQYLVGKANFYGLFFTVNPAVLIPRSETEELVHLILETIPTINLQRGLDIGTGSGCIPITLKYKRPNWDIHASDISQSALQVAEKNAVANDTMVHFHQFDILDGSDWPPLLNFDFIVSNPPYIPPSEKSLMPDAVLNHEPALALFAPETDPLLFYRKIISFAKKHLANKGSLFFEVNEFNAREVATLLEENSFVEVLLEKDMQGKDRMVFGRLG